MGKLEKNSSLNTRKKNIQKIIFFVSFTVILMTFMSMEELGICRNLLGIKSGCLIKIKDLYENLFLIFSISIFPFSLITYPMKEQVFQRWFRFAVWAVPALVIAFFVFPTSVRGGFGIGSMITEGFNTIILIILFSAFFITSIVKIIRAYKESK
jgi:hypothetical protein